MAGADDVAVIQSSVLSWIPRFQKQIEFLGPQLILLQFRCCYQKRFSNFSLHKFFKLHVKCCNIDLYWSKLDKAMKSTLPLPVIFKPWCSGYEVAFVFSKWTSGFAEALPGRKFDYSILTFVLYSSFSFPFCFLSLFLFASKTFMFDRFDLVWRLRHWNFQGPCFQAVRRAPRTLQACGIIHPLKRWKILLLNLLKSLWIATFIQYVTHTVYLTSLVEHLHLVHWL